MTYRDLGGLEGAELDAFVARQRDFFTRLGREVEWKYHGYDLPADLPERLAAAGFEARGSARPSSWVRPESWPVPWRRPPGSGCARRAGRADLERIRKLEETVWDADHGWLPDVLERDLAGPGDPVRGGDRRGGRARR